MTVKQRGILGYVTYHMFNKIKFSFSKCTHQTRRTNSDKNYSKVHACNSNESNCHRNETNISRNDHADNNDNNNTNHGPGEPRGYQSTRKRMGYQSTGERMGSDWYETKGQRRDYQAMGEFNKGGF